MRLTKKKGIYHMDFTVLGHRVQMSTGTRNRSMALEIMKEARAALLQDLVSKKVERNEKRKKDITLSQAIDRAYKERWQFNKDGETTKTRALVCCKLLGDIWLADITTRKITELKNKFIERGKTPPTINRHLAHLRTVLRMAKREWEILDSVPYIKLFKERKHRIRVITLEEERTLLKILKSDIPNRSESRKYFPEVADLVEVLIDTGMRLGEGLSINYKDNIDLESEVINLYPEMVKSGKPRCIPMTPRVKEILERRAKDGECEKPFTKNRWGTTRAFNWAKKKMGLSHDKEFVPHALRHTYASRLIAAGVDLYTVQALLGHSTFTETEKYAHLQIDKLREAVKRLSPLPSSSHGKPVNPPTTPLPHTVVEKSIERIPVLQ